MNSRPVFTAVAAAMLTFGCAEQQESAQTTETARNSLGTSTVEAPDGTAVPESLYRYYAQNALQKPADQLTEEERNAVLDSLVSLQLLADEAEERGLPNERTIAVQLELQRMQVLARSMIDRFVEENPPTEAELREEYEATSPEGGTTEYKARHILLESEQDAREVIDELESGADFAAMAEEHSTGPTGPDGGDLGWFTADTMVAPFAEAVAQMEVGTFSSEPVETQFGWHVILVEDQRQTEGPGLDAVRSEVTNRVNQEKVEEYIESLREGN